eukprot:222683_1
MDDEITADDTAPAEKIHDIAQLLKQCLCLFSNTRFRRICKALQPYIPEVVLRGNLEDSMLQIAGNAVLFLYLKLKCKEHSCSHYKKTQIWLNQCSKVIKKYNINERNEILKFTNIIYSKSCSAKFSIVIISPQHNIRNNSLLLANQVHSTTMEQDVNQHFQTLLKIYKLYGLHSLMMKMFSQNFKLQSTYQSTYIESIAATEHIDLLYVLAMNYEFIKTKISETLLLTIVVSENMCHQKMKDACDMLCNRMEIDYDPIIEWTLICSVCITYLFARTRECRTSVARIMRKLFNILKSEYVNRINNVYGTLLFYMKATVEYMVEKDYEESCKHYVLVICNTESLYMRALALKHVIFICYKNKEYFIGIKLLTYVYSLCHGFILPTFVNQCRRHIRIFKKAIKKICCKYCGNKNALKACIGCMKAVYCSRKCQKIDWKKRHNQICTKKWSKLYECIRPIIMV